VDVDDVALPNEADQLVGGLEQARLIQLVLGAPQRPSIAFGVVQAVVDSLGESEELRVPGNRQPAKVDAGSAAVCEQGVEHLGDAAAARRRVDVPHHPAAEHLLGGRRRLLDLSVGPAQQRPEPLRRNRPYRDLLQCAHNRPP
jgi:hypothetical protein